MQIPSKHFWEVFKRTPGALSCTEAIAIYNLSLLAPSMGYSIELGTHKGKSTMAAAIGLRSSISNLTSVFHLVDPEFKDPQWKQNLYDTLNLCLENKGGIDFNLWADLSTNVLPNIEKLLSYAFVDSGTHDNGVPLLESKMLEDKMVPGGLIVYHDFKNQFREPAEAAQYLVDTGKYEWVDINWQEIIDYVSQHNLEEGNDSWHVYDDRPFPNFVGAVKRK